MHDAFSRRRYLIPFRASLLPQIFTDTLVIGAGVAGLRAAVAAGESGCEAIVLAKGELGVSNTAWAQGGIAAVLGEGDSVESHVRDTLEAGAGLCDEAAVREVASRGGERVRELMAWGMRVDRDARGEVALGLEGGHSGKRIVHADGDATGKELARVLLEKARATKGVRVFERCFALDLITAGEGEGASCVGAITHHPRYGLQVIWAKGTVLASGGAGALWRETTNPRVATADGVAMAWRAGASVADMAFMQFHPTALYVAGASRALISEAVRGEGATLVDRSGRRFMVGEHERAELAARDVVSRAIVRHMAREGSPNVWMDARGVEGFAERFPGIAKTLEGVGLDASKDLIPVRPAAHYMVGGVAVDGEGRTDVAGLYAVGEASCTGLHGANRLASNSLLEGLVYGEVVGRVSAEMKGGTNGWGVAGPRTPMQVISDIPLSERGDLDLGDVLSSVRSAMWRNVGVERSGAKLRDVVEMLEFWARYTLDKIFDEPAGWETQNMLWAGGLVARSALWREESRGSHARSDFGEAREEFAAHDVWKRGREGVEKRAVISGRGGVRVETRKVGVGT
ncbi:MAG: L-aspartate oxidase [Phycisphaerales bacterium]